MRRAFGVPSALVFTLVAPVRAALIEPPTLAEERAIATGVQHHDRARLDRLLDDDFVLRSAPDIDRATWLRNAVTRCWGDRFSIDHFQARATPRAVVASFELTINQDPGTCRPATVRSLITDVWILRDGAWRLHVRHASPVPQGSDLASQYGVAPEPPPVWQASSDLSFVGTRGNTSTTTLGLRGRIQHRRATGATTRIDADFLTSEAAAVTRTRSLTADIRHTLHRRAHTHLFVAAQYAHDRFAGIERRIGVSAGIGHELGLRSRQTLLLEASAGQIDERRSDPARLRFASATAGASYAWTRSDKTMLTDDLTLVADLESARNWRGTNNVTLSLALNGTLAVKLWQTLDYRHVPVPGFRRMDVRTGASLGLVWTAR
jgi:putative salt-induced outer membrane protein YdiY